MTYRFFIPLFILALTAPFAFAETQNVRISGSLDVIWFYRHNLDLRDNNDASVIPVGTAVPTGGAAGSAINRSDGDDFWTTMTEVEISADLTNNVSAVITLLNQRDWNADVDGVAGATIGPDNAAEEFDIGLELAYLELREIFYPPLTMTIGRQDLFFGRGFVIGPNSLDNQGTIQADEFSASDAFDAVRLTLDFNPWTIDFVYSKIIENSHNAEDDQDLYIVYLTYLFSEHEASADLYYVGSMDRAALSGAAGTHNNTTHTFGGRLQFDPISQMTLGVEGAFQRGKNRAALTDPERDVEAWALDLFAEYRWNKSPWQPSLGVEYVYLSGEDDLSATTASYSSWNSLFRDAAYGEIHDYIENTYATGQSNDQDAAQNIQILDIYGTLQPLEDMELEAHFYTFWAAENMHVVTVDPTSGVLSSDLGYEIDFFLTYDYTEDLSFSLSASWFFPGNLYSSPNDATARQTTAQATVTF